MKGKFEIPMVETIEEAVALTHTGITIRMSDVKGPFSICHYYDKDMSDISNIFRRRIVKEEIETATRIEIYMETLEKWRME